MAELYRSDICEVDVGKSLVRSYAGIVLATGDCKANRFGAVVVRNGEPVDLSTAAVTGYFIRPNYETVVCEGAKDGNVAYVDLPAACYTQDGTFSLAIKIVSTEVTQTVRVIDGCIRLTQTDTLIDPGEVVPSLDTLLAHIAEMEAVVANADSVAAKAEAAVEDAKKVAEIAASPIVSEVSGAVAMMNDAADRDVMVLVSTIKPTVNGVSAVTLTRTGKNLLGFKDFTAAASAYVDTCVGGVFRREVTAVHNTSYVVGVTGMGNIANSHIPAGTYTFKLTRISGVTYPNPYVQVTLSDDSIVKLANGVATTLPMDGTITGIRMESNYTNYRVGDTAEFVLQIEVGETATSYELYNGFTLTASLPETVYGGTLDWTAGLLTITHGADGAALAAPVTHQLVPQTLEMLRGSNTLWSDTGDTSVVYVADTKLYIDNKFEALQNAILAMGADI